MEKQYCPYCMSPVNPGEACPSCGLTAGAYSPAAHHLPPGTVLKDRYLIGRVLGEGGFGITYIGCDLRLELRVAIKEYFPTDKANRVSRASLSVSSYFGAAGSRYEEGKERFLQEARAMAKMDKQPVIVSVRDFFEEYNTAYIVMEYVDGTTFKDLVEQKGGRIPAGELLHIIEPLFSALSAMHDRGLIHRDISPDNLMLESGEIRLLDFGCAREAQSGDATLTIALKHGYAPVEQYQNKGQGPWTDVYALSATIYYCLTGRKPPQSMDRLVEDELILPRKLGVDLTERQERALLHGMGVRPRRRFQSVQELHAALYEGVDFFPEPEPPAPEKPEHTGNREPKKPEATGNRELERAAGVTAEERRKAPERTGGDRNNRERTPENPGKPRNNRERTPENPGKAQAFLKKRKWLIPACGAALALAALLCVLLPRGGKREPTLPTKVTTAPRGTETSAPPEAQQDTDFLAMLSDDSVKEIVLDAAFTKVRTQGVVEITKPVIVPEGCCLEAGLTSFLIGPGGSLEIRGQLDAYGSLVVREGGSLRVADGGSCNVWHLWLEREEDFILEPGASADLHGADFETQKNRDHDSALTILNENVFTDAVTVTTARELQNAAEKGGPIVIAGNIILTETVALSRPVRIESGARLVGTLFLSEGGYLVNYGTLSGELALGDRCAGAVNYGQLQGDVWLGSGALLNRGVMETQPLRVDGGRLINYGTLSHIGSSDGRFLELRSLLINAGELTLGGSSPYLQLRGDTRMVNTGSLRVLDGARAIFDGTLINVGSLTVERGGILSGYGFIDITDPADDGGLNMEPGSVLQFDGVIAYAGGQAVRNRMEPAVTGAVDNSILRWLSFGWDECYCWVDTSRWLKSWMDCESLPDGSTFTIGMSGNIEMNQTFTIDKGLAVSGGATLTVNGDLILEGEDAFLYNDGTVDLTGHNLILRDGAMMVNRGCLRNVGSVLVSGASQHNSVAYSLLMNLGWEDGGFGNIILEQGGRFISLSPLNLEADAQVRDGSLMALGGLRQGSARIEIGEQGYARIALLLEMNADALLVNRGTLYVEGWAPDPVVLGGTVNNYGTLVQNHDDREESPVLQGVLNNYGVMESCRDTWVSGVLNNRGTLCVDEGFRVTATGSGQITGNQPQLRTD